MTSITLKLTVQQFDTLRAIVEREREALNINRDQLTDAQRREYIQRDHALEALERAISA